MTLDRTKGLDDVHASVHGSLAHFSVLLVLLWVRRSARGQTSSCRMSKREPKIRNSILNPYSMISHTQMDQLGESSGEVLEKQVLVLGVRSGPLQELWVSLQGQISREHHQLAYE